MYIRKTSKPRIKKNKSIEDIIEEGGQSIEHILDKDRTSQDISSALGIVNKNENSMREIELKGL